MEWNGRAFGEEEGGSVHLVALGMHADAALHVKSHPHEQREREGHLKEHSEGHSLLHGTGQGDLEDEVRHIVVSQVLLGLYHTLLSLDCRLEFHMARAGLGR